MQINPESHIHSSEVAYLPDMKKFKKWQNRILVGSMVGYAGFYLIRNNMPFAICALQQEFGFSKIQIGMITSTFYLIYGFGKGFVGILGDRSDARYFISIGLLGACCVNLGITFANSLMAFVSLWAFNALFQSMGWPACARLLTQWFSNKELGTKWAVWNISQPIGSLSMYLFSAYAIYIKNWRFMFLIPALVALCIVVFIFNRLRDNPENAGIAPLNENEEAAEDEKTSFFNFLLQKVYKNPFIWMICFANFFLYFIRMSIVTWAPIFFFEQHSSLAAITHTSVYEIAAIIGGISAGYISDRFKNRGLVSFAFMMGVTICVGLFWVVPSYLRFLIMMALGFFITGPQILIGVAASQFASKKAVGAATGLTGIFGSLGSALTGIGAGYLIETYSWNMFFLVMFFASIVGSVLLYITYLKSQPAS